MPSTRFTTGPRPLPIPRPGSSPDQAAAHCPTGFGATPAGHLPAPPRRRLSNPGQAVPTHRAPHPGTLCLRRRTGGATGQQRRRTPPATSGRQSQGQRRHPVGRGQQQQDDPGRFIRHLARPRTQSPRRLPATALFCRLIVQSRGPGREGENHLDTQFFHGPSKLGGHPSGLMFRLVLEDGVAVGIEGEGNAAEPEQVLHQQGVVAAVFMIAEQGVDHFAGGVVHRQQQRERRAVVPNHW